MKCFHCEKDFNEVTTQYLKCGECSNSYHLTCTKDITEVEYNFLLSSKAIWKCHTCISLKKFDNTPVTPVSVREEFPPLQTGEMSKACVLCCKGFSHNAHRATCSKCQAIFHFKCLGTTKEKYKTIAKWLCNVCRPVHDSSKQVRSCGSSEGSGKGMSLVPADENSSDKPTDKTKLAAGDVTNADILRAMTILRTELLDKNRELTDSMNKYSDWVAEVSTKIDDVSKKVTNLVDDISGIRQENVNLKKLVKDLTDKVCNLEQAAKDNVIEIQGVPYETNESVLNLLSKISTATGFELNESMIDYCFRYKSESTSWPGGIVARFVRKIDMANFMQKRKDKRNLNSRDLGFMAGNASVIYVNQSLTPAKRKLLKAARQCKKDKGYTYVWVNGGRIFVRKNEGDKAKEIKSDEDLDKLD